MLDIETKILSYQNQLQKEKTLLELLYWDLETQTPTKQVANLLDLIDMISSRHYDLFTNTKFISLCKDALKQNININTKKLIENILEEISKLEMYTKDETLLMQKHCNESSQKWKEARQLNDFSIFVPHLLKGIEYKKDFIQRMKKVKIFSTNYDYLLNEFEKNLTVAECDLFFDKIKEHIVPLYKKIQAQNNFIPHLKLSEHAQDLLVQKFAQVAGFDSNKGVIGRSTHPFSTTIAPKYDVRMTYRYEKTNGLDCIFTILHECGHSLQGQLSSKSLIPYNLNYHDILIVGESTSRTYENYFGRNEKFIEFATPIINEIANLNIEKETYIKMFNQVATSSKIRVEADELAYPIHVLIRYEIEKSIFNEDIDVRTLEQLWNQKYKEYLNVDIENVNEGILQDGHWSSWSFGYFPTYAMGSALGVSFYNVLAQNINIDEALQNGDFTKINAFYEDKIFKYGDTLTRNELIKKITGKEFEPQDYINYLLNKYEGTN